MAVAKPDRWSASDIAAAALRPNVMAAPDLAPAPDRPAHLLFALDPSALLHQQRHMLVDGLRPSDPAQSSTSSRFAPDMAFRIGADRVQTVEGGDIWVSLPFSILII
jgi:hypothetical protein